MSPLQRASLLSGSLLLALACGGVSDLPSDPPPGSASSETPSGQNAADAKTPAVPPDAAVPQTASAAGTGRVPSWVSPLCQTPQVLEANDLFREALSTPAGPLEGGMLLCDVSMSSTPPKGRSWDVFGNPPDPGVTLTIGDDTSRPDACASDTMEAVLSWPQVTLPQGAKLKLHVQDVDIRRHDAAGVDVAVFEGRFPLDLAGEYFRASCRSLSAATVTARIPERITLARRSLKALRAAMAPTVSSADLGFPFSEEYMLRRGIEDVAGHVGWTDDRVGGLLVDRESVWGDWDQLARAAVTQAAASAPETVTVEGLTLVVRSAECSATCSVRVQLSHTGAQPILFHPQQHSLVAVRDDGWDAVLSTSYETSTDDDGAVSVASGTPLEVVLVESSDLSDVRPPRGTTPIRLLRVDGQPVRLP